MAQKGKERPIFAEAKNGHQVRCNEPDRTPERMIAFSDAIFAFAITLLAFSIKVPDVPGDMNSAQIISWMATLLPTFFIYVLSFWVIANFWIAHHHMFERIRRLDDKLLWMNLAYLFVISLLPFPTAVLGDYGHTSVAAILYASFMIVAGLLLAWMWLYAARRQHLGAGVSPAEIRSIAVRSLSATGIFVLSIPIALFSPFFAELSWVLIIFAKPLAQRYASSWRP